MRELEVIPVLLDCCNIDARNPCILLKYKFVEKNTIYKDASTIFPNYASMQCSVDTNR